MGLKEFALTGGSVELTRCVKSMCSFLVFIIYIYIYISLNIFIIYIYIYICMYTYVFMT